MSRSLRRGVLAAVAALTIAPLAAACGTGDHPQTLEVKPDSVATTVGDIQIQNAYIITEPQGSGPATVTAKVFNNSTSAQKLTAIAVHGATAQVTLTAADGTTGPLTIPAQGSITLGGSGNPSAALADSKGIALGNMQSTIFDFSASGQVAVAPSVVPATHYFSAFGPSITATPSGGPSGSPSTGPSGSATPLGSASGSPSASGKPAKSAKTGKATPTASGSAKS